MAEGGVHAGFSHLTPTGWEAAVAAAGPAALLLVIEQRIGPMLAARVMPEDILQESLLHAWRDRQMHEWRGPRPFRNWILSIIDHRIADGRDLASAKKRAGDARALPLSPGGNGTRSQAAGAEPPSSTTPSRIAWYREQAAAIRTALDSLPDEVREVVRLRLVDQIQIDEIAARLALSPSAVRHRFRRGADLFRYRLISLLGTMPGGSESAGSAPAPR